MSPSDNSIPPIPKPVSEVPKTDTQKTEPKAAKASAEKEPDPKAPKIEAIDEATSMGAAAENIADEAKSTVQNGFSRFDETASKVASEASAMAEDATDAAESYAHKGLASFNKVGNVVAGAITQRPFVSLLVAGIGGALLAASRRG